MATTSKYDSERKAMGLPLASSSSTSQSSVKSKYDDERQAYRMSDENAQYSEMMKPARLLEVQNQPPKPTVPLGKKVLTNVKKFADKSGMKKDLGYLADAASAVFNAPGNLIRKANEIGQKVQKVEDKLIPPKKPLFKDGGTIGQHLADLNKKTDIPGVTTGPVANFIRGATDMSDFGTGRALDEVLGHKDYLAGRDTKAAKAGGIAGIAIPLAGGGAKLAAFGASKLSEKVLKDYLGNFLDSGKAIVRNGTKDMPLGLPAPAASAVKTTGHRVVTPDVIYGDSTTGPSNGPLTLPEPKLQEPTAGRLSRQTNLYLQKYENLIAEAKSRGLDKPQNYIQGRTLESELESLWSQMADKNDPNLQDLIALAHPEKVNKLSPDLLRLARDRQAGRGVAGAPLPIKTIADRYNGGVVADAQSPIQRVGRAPGNEPIPGQQATPKSAAVNEAPQPSKYKAEREALAQGDNTSLPVTEAPAVAQPEPIKLTPNESGNPAEDVVQSTDQRVRDKVVNFFDEAEQAAKERLKAKRNTLSSNPIDQYTDYAIIGASKLVKGSVKFVDWSAEMIKDFGEEIKPHLKAIFDRSKASVKDAERQASGVAHLPGVNSGIDPLKGNKADINGLENALDNSANWKDKARLLLNRETMERNFEDLMGKDAPIMKKTYIEPIQKAAADRQRFIAQERSDIKDLGIKYKSKEDALVQEYGEGKITEEQLKQRAPDTWQQVKTAAETMRAKYDTYLNKANEVLKRNGYTEIPKRKDYFPHYEEMDGLLHKLGFGFEDHTLTADLNGLTSNLRPNKNFFGHFLQRKGEDTTLGALAGHDRYIEGISKVIHQTDNIKRLRGLEKSLRETHEGTTHLSDFLAHMTDYTNVLAGKKSELDRSLEAAIGRNLYSAVDTVKKRVGANMIGGSISSALTNTIPVTQLLATTSKPSVLKGLHSAIQNITGNDGISQTSNFLSRRFTSNKLAMGKLDKAQNVAGSVFKFIDHFTSNVVIRSKYYENLKKGMSEETALHRADQYATKMMADRSEGSTPTLFHSRTFGLITQFQLEVNNQISHLFKDLPRSMSKGKYVSAIAQVFVYDYLYNRVYEKVTGNRPAFDPVGTIIHAVQDYSNPRLSRGQATKKLLTNAGNNLPFASILTGGGRIPIGSAIPNGVKALEGTSTWGKELMKPVKYLTLPFGGSQINKTFSGIGAVNKGGVSRKNSDGEEVMKYPIAKNGANLIRGALFGPSSLPETNKFYRNNNPTLTPLETQQLKKSGNDPKVYEHILTKKQIGSLDDKLSKLHKNKNMSEDARRKGIDSILMKRKDLVSSLKD